MKVINIISDSIVDGEGLRTTVFFAGCPHKCVGCHNLKSWNYDVGTDMSVEEIALEILNNPINHVTLSGGEPMVQDEEELIRLVTILKREKRNVWCYTGYLFEDLTNRDIMKYIDVLVDGKFDINQRNLDLLYKGSENQRIIDVQKSLRSGQIVLFDTNSK
jgi:anaerobic ribonucleoside-triphosphate reductase activating protein